MWMSDDYVPYHGPAVVWQSQSDTARINRYAVVD
jgi:hypothetical protein